MKTKSLFVATSVIEIGAGLALLASPALAASILIGSAFDTPADSVVGRVAGAALLALGVACWCARNDVLSRSASGLIVGMLLYNIVVALVLVYAGIDLQLFGVGLWPTVALHVVMAIWCLVVLSRLGANKEI
jgi:hypothetical protein